MTNSQRFWNYTEQRFESECAERREKAWYIKMGFAGFNSRPNNAQGYASKKRAEAACWKYQNKEH